MREVVAALRAEEKATASKLAKIQKLLAALDEDSGTGRGKGRGKGRRKGRKPGPKPGSKKGGGKAKKGSSGTGAPKLVRKKAEKTVNQQLDEVDELKRRKAEKARRVAEEE